ncbi:sensor domain-containing diguanylate cyclase [Umboniibacter marinipuniceus]|uniref:diguanylate cyclase n=1 Tax=Umboniibacter marinipuniceus TaxID=569599 RepID=A0A3M0AE12_9GAMM|nr:sensor domain-containing diguanylate cyclase [Umboniibacter marinipuniceus]RMA80998.1 PAS domain S-box-containing protein/diguanylate cyclase (GGDEF)-like protein [Umboniibacter marinipuniceus]
MNKQQWDSFDHSLLSSVLTIQQSFIGQLDLKSAFSRILSELLTLTGSDYGFIGEIHHDPSPYMIAHALTDVSWDSDSKAFYEQQMAKGFEFRNLNTLFGVSLITQELVISNDPAADPRSGGLPRGHPRMASYLGLPIIHDGKMLGLIGLANRPGGYTSQLAALLEPITFTCATMVNAFRQQQQKQQIEAELLANNQLLDAILLNVRDGIVLADYQGVIEIANAAAAELLCTDAEALTDSHLQDYLNAEGSRLFAAKLKRFLLTGDSDEFSSHINIQPKHRSKGSPQFLELGVSELKLANRKLFVINLHDVSARREQESKLEQANISLRELAETDDLTELSNRRAFDSLLEDNFSKCKRLDLPLMMAIVDIDHFKEYNDHYGHPQGDEALRSLAKIFKSKLKRCVDSCARVGGEEFAILVAGGNRDDFNGLLKSVNKALTKLAIEHRASPFNKLTISIGCSELTRKMTAPAELYQAADNALYEAKNAGRNQRIWHPTNATN